MIIVLNRQAFRTQRFFIEASQARGERKGMGAVVTEEIRKQNNLLMTPKR